MNRTALLFGLGAASAITTFVMLEWTFPYCSVLSDGPMSGVYGMPLPYLRMSGTSSATVEVAPLVWALNVLILVAAFYPLVAAALARTAGIVRQRVGRVLMWSGTLLCLTAAAFQLAQLAFGQAIVSVAQSPYTSYVDFRPIGFSEGLSTQCTPSRYWFSSTQWADEQRRRAVAAEQK